MIEHDGYYERLFAFPHGNECIEFKHCDGQFSIIVHGSGAKAVLHNNSTDPLKMLYKSKRLFKALKKVKPKNANKGPYYIPLNKKDEMGYTGMCVVSMKKDGMEDMWFIEFKSCHKMALFIIRPGDEWLLDATKAALKRWIRYVKWISVIQAWAQTELKVRLSTSWNEKCTTTLAHHLAKITYSIVSATAPLDVDEELRKLSIYDTKGLEAAKALIDVVIVTAQGQKNTLNPNKVLKGIQGQIDPASP